MDCLYLKFYDAISMIDEVLLSACFVWQFNNNRSSLSSHLAFSPSIIFAEAILSVIPDVPQDIERTIELVETEWSVAERSFHQFAAAPSSPSVGLPHTRGTMPLVGRVKFLLSLLGVSPLLRKSVPLTRKLSANSPAVCRSLSPPPGSGVRNGGSPAGF